MGKGLPIWKLPRRTTFVLVANGHAISSLACFCGVRSIPYTCTTGGR